MRRVTFTSLPFTKSCRQVALCLMDEVKPHARSKAGILALAPQQAVA